MLDHDVLIIIIEEKAKGKMGDGKGNIQSGKNRLLLESTTVITAC